MNIFGKTIVNNTSVFYWFADDYTIVGWFLVPVEVQSTILVASWKFKKAKKRGVENRWTERKKLIRDRDWEWICWVLYRALSTRFNARLIVSDNTQFEYRNNALINHWNSQVKMSGIENNCINSNPIKISWSLDEIYSCQVRCYSVKSQVRVENGKRGWGQSG